MLITFCGVVASGRISVGYVYMSEFLTPKNMLVVATIFSILDGGTNLFGTLYFEFISKNYLWLATFGLTLNLMCVLGVAFWVPESIQWLLNAG